MSNSHSNPANFFSHLAAAQQRLDEGFANLPPAAEPTLDESAAAILLETATRLQDNFPYAHPLYAGQMLKPPHPIARAAYALAMSINPNNHALDGGRASSAMELEAVGALARMFNLPQHLGHLTSAGTYANLEALWVASQLHPGKAIAASTQAHYTHSRITSVLKLPFVSIPTDAQARMDLTALEQALTTQNIGTVVATLGTTATGAVDPLDQILALQQQYKFRIHVDAAYGGYFTLASNLSPSTRAAYASIPDADSIVVDPHKHGLQPYGCGAILFRDPTVGLLYKHDSPYTYFSSPDLHLGEISLECSRAGASAVALWATQRLLPYTPAGEFARNLEASRQAAINLHERLTSDQRILTLAHPPQLDIVCWAIAAPTPAESSSLAHNIFTAAAKLDLHLALVTLPLDLFPSTAWPDHANRSETVTCLRSVLMKPEHLPWLDQIWQRLDSAVSSQIPVNTS